jgi:hypothetical protein
MSRTVWLCEGLWDHAIRDGEKFKPFKTTDVAVIEAYKLAKKDRLLLNDKHYSFMTDCLYRKGMVVFKRALSNLSGNSTLQQDGNCRGWGISTNSKQEAVELAENTSTLYSLVKIAEKKKEQDKIESNLNKIRNIPTNIGNKPVYFYIKQDYDYRGLCDSFDGKMTISEVADWEIRNVEKNDLEKLVFKKTKNKNFYYSFLDAFDYGRNKVTQSLMKKGFFKCADETGYIAFSTKSAKHAKDLVKELVLKDKFED